MCVTFDQWASELISALTVCTDSGCRGSFFLMVASCEDRTLSYRKRCRALNRFDTKIIHVKRGAIQKQLSFALCAQLKCMRATECFVNRYD